MFLTLEECSSAWKAAGQHGSKEDRIARNARWISFYNYAANAQAGDINGPDAHSIQIAQILKEADVFCEGSSLLDVGCGTGGYSLAFSQLGASVTALDMEAATLDVLRQRAQANNCDIQTVQAMWEEYEPEASFDTVFSSMCPAICDYEELLRFESMAKDYCCLIAVTRGSYDLHRKRLMKELDVRPSGGMTTEALWYFNMLYLMGRQPEVRHFTRHFDYQQPIESAVERNKVYFEIFGLSPQESEPKLRRYFERNVQDGLIRDESHINTALIWWKVPPKP